MRLTSISDRFLTLRKNLGMLKITDISKSYGDDIILDKINFTLNRGERAGLIGPNGAGKSTLLRIITKLEQPDKGSVWLEPAARLGYLAQALVYGLDATVGQVVSESIGPALQLLDEIERLTEAISITKGEEFNTIMERYSNALEEAERLDAYGASARLAEVLAGLGLAHVGEDTTVAILSGGQKTRLGLARLLLTRPDLLLLDEPTNHLDITALAWLQEFICQYKGAVLIVSHDRAFLDGVVTRILALDKDSHKIKEYAGNYSDYAEEMEQQKAKLWEDYQRQQEYIAKVQSDIRGIEQHARNIEGETIDFYVRKRALKVARRGVVRKKKLQKLLDSEDKIDKPRQNWQMKLDFGEAPASGQIVLTLDKISKSFDGRALFQEVKADLRQGERVALVGPNGAGKTTLLRIITGQVAADTGTVRMGANVRPGYFSQEQEGLNPHQTALEAVREVAAISETEARNFMHYFLFSGDAVFTPVGQLSYGERARLVLTRLVLSGVNFLLLDEPLNHLDITSRQEFEEALENFEGTVLAVAHDRYFIEQFAERLWAIMDGKLLNFYELTDYEERMKDKG